MPPVAKTIARIDTLHGEVRTDNYFWIRNKSDPQVISYLEAEKKNALSRARFLIYRLAAPPYGIVVPCVAHTCQRPSRLM